MKKCSKCGRTDVLFSPRQTRCKACRRDEARRWRESPKGKKKHRASWLKYKHHTKEYPREKLQASLLLNRAIKARRITRGTVCAQADNECSGKIEGHHEDYSKPYDVIWLCTRHHKILHHRRQHIDDEGE